MTHSLDKALHVVALAERDFTDLEVVLIGSIISKADDIERETSRRPTHVAVHPYTLPGIGRIFDLKVVRAFELEQGRAYLMVCST